MTDNYMNMSQYLDVLEILVEDLSGGMLTPEMVRHVLITPEEGTVFEVFYYDHDGLKVIIPDEDGEPYVPTYYYRVKPVDATISW